MRPSTSIEKKDNWVFHGSMRQRVILSEYRKVYYKDHREVMLMPIMRHREDFREKRRLEAEAFVMEVK